jgi:hypothetical protein
MVEFEPKDMKDLELVDIQKLNAETGGTLVDQADALSEKILGIDSKTQSDILDQALHDIEHLGETKNWSDLEKNIANMTKEEQDILVEKYMGKMTEEEKKFVNTLSAYAGDYYEAVKANDVPLQLEMKKKFVDEYVDSLFASFD